MFRYKSIKEQLLEERRKAEALKAQNIKQKSDIDYLAMMTDVELETEEEIKDE